MTESLTILFVVTVMRENDELRGYFSTRGVDAEDARRSSSAEERGVLEFLVFVVHGAYSEPLG